MKTSSYGILLTNVGSPDTLSVQSVGLFLKKFLSDKRVVEIPRFIWWPLLHGLILRTRPKKSLALYQKIWTKEGSPLTVTSQQLAEALQIELNVPVTIGMHYGNPSIQAALDKLKAAKVEEIIILPLYPQYSGTTTAATFDQVASVLKGWRRIPKLIYINNYHSHPLYIDSIANSIRQHSIQHLLFSFHGIPERCVKKGDPYAQQCLTTAHLIAEKLNLSAQQWTVSFQSRLGRARWLKPYTDTLLSELPKRGIHDIHVVCPGFAIDCLETLEEIAIRGREQFFKAGGKSFQYIHALNTSIEHQNLIRAIINQ